MRKIIFILAILSSTCSLAQKKAKTMSGQIVNFPPIAAELTNSPAGNIAALTIQTATEELDTEKVNLLNPEISVIGDYKVDIISNTPVQTLISGMQPGMQGNSSSSFKIGQSDTAKNSAEIRFNYAGNANSNNALSLGLTGVPDVLTFRADSKAFYNTSEIATTADLSSVVFAPFSREVGSLSNITTATPINTVINATLPADWISQGWNLKNTSFAILVTTYSANGLSFTNVLNVVGGDTGTYLIASGKTAAGSGFTEIYIQFSINGESQIDFQTLQIVQDINGLGFQKCSVRIML